MELYLQMGHGMKAHAVELIRDWGSGTAILSPKNQSFEQLTATAKAISKLNGSVIIDPQFYVPRAEIDQLQQHTYWPSSYDTGLFFSGPSLLKMLNTLLQDYVFPCNASAFLIPSLLLSDISDDWERITETIISECLKLNMSIPRYLTLCVGPEILLSEEKTQGLLELLENYPIDGFYIIPVHPQNVYLVDNPAWLLNLLDLIAGIKLLSKKAIVGYSNHQSLLLSLAKADAICAGTWLKTRMFPLGDFEASEDDSGGGRRSTWYYCPQTLSEFQLQFLDVAHRLAILDNLKVSPHYNVHYADILFSGAQPTTVNFSEREAFRHYLSCLRKQCMETSKQSYSETKAYLQMLFETALDLSEHFRQKGVRAKHRDFRNVGDSSIAAIDAFDSLRGFAFGARWNSIR